MYYRRRRILGTQRPSPDGVTIVLHPVLFFGDDGDNATFTVGAVSGNASALSYQWQEWNGSAWVTATGGNLSGETSTTLTVTSIGGADYGRTFRAAVTNDTSTRFSSSASIASSDVTITADPAAWSDFEGETATFSGAAISGDSSALSFQWQENTGSWVNLTDGGSISGSTTSTLTVDPVSLSDDGRQFRFVATNAGDSKTSASASMSVADGGVVITLNPVNATVDEGEAVVFSALATSNNGSDTFYQWQSNTGSGWTNLVNGAGVTGAQNDAVILDDLRYPEDDQNQYRCQIANSVETVETTTATLTVIEVIVPDNMVTEGGMNLISERDEQLITEVAA